MTLTIPHQLPAGETTRRDPNRLPLAPHLHPPFIKLVEPLDLFANTGCILQLNRASALQNHNPDATHVEVIVHRSGDHRYIVLVPRTDPGDPRVEGLTFQPDRGGAWMRRADDVLITGGIAPKPGETYYMTTALTQLEGFGWVVAGNWTQATSDPPRPGSHLTDEGAATAATEPATAVAQEEP